MVDHKSSNSIEKTAFELWKSGIPLNDARESFGKTRNLAKIAREARKNALKISENSSSKFPEIGDTAVAFISSIGALQADFAASAQVRSAMENRLFERLRSGELVAWGFPTHERDASEPQRVPPYLLDPAYAQWSKRSFVGFDRQFADVTISEIQPESGSIPISAKARNPQKRGPKPFGLMVAAAIDSLRTGDPNFDHRSQEKRINDVRAEVARQNPARFPGGAQPGHTTVWNYVTGRKAMK